MNRAAVPGASLDPEFVQQVMDAVMRVTLHSQRVTYLRGAGLHAESDEAQVAADLGKLELIHLLTSYRVSNCEGFENKLTVTRQQMAALVQQSIKWKRDLVRELGAYTLGYERSPAVEAYEDETIFFTAAGMLIGIEPDGYTHT